MATPSACFFIAIPLKTDFRTRIEPDRVGELRQCVQFLPISCCRREENRAIRLKAIVYQRYPVMQQSRCSAGGIVSSQQHTGIMYTKEGQMSLEGKAMRVGTQGRRSRLGDTATVDQSQFSKCQSATSLGSAAFCEQSVFNLPVRRNATPNCSMSPKPVQ
jgi:hypothetical protein